MGRIAHAGPVAAALGMLALGAVAGGMAAPGGGWLHWLCKPAATALLLGWVLSSGRRGGPARRYRRWIAAGLACSLLGDVALMPPWGAFLAGLAAFLLAHLCYIAAFWPGGSRGPLAAAALPVVLAAGANLAGLWWHLPPDMRLPVLAYVGVIALMATLALSAALGPAGRPRRGAALGAWLFLASDSWLAWDRFAGPLPGALAGILATYWAAQWLIAASAVDGPRQ